MGINKIKKKTVIIFILVRVPEPELTADQYATYLPTIRAGTHSDRILRVLLPKRKERKKFHDTYGSVLTCCPPPIFILLFVALQIAMFVFYFVREKKDSSTETIGQDTLDSMWIYDPNKVIS